MMLFKGSYQADLEVVYAENDTSPSERSSSDRVSMDEVKIDLNPADLSLALVTKKQCWLIDVSSQRKNLVVDCRISPKLNNEQQSDEKNSHIQHPVITNLLWLNSRILALAYSNGFVRFFDGQNGDMLFCQKFHGCSVLQIDVAGGFYSNLNSSSRDGLSRADQVDGLGDLWILYEDGVIVTIPMAELLVPKTLRVRSEISLKSGVLSFRKWRLSSSSTTKDSKIYSAYCCGPTKPTLFQSHARLGSYTIITIGTDPCLGFHKVGSEHRTLHLGHIASAVATKISSVAYNAVSSFAKNYVWQGWGSSHETRELDAIQNATVDNEQDSNMISDEKVVGSEINSKSEVEKDEDNTISSASADDVSLYRGFLDEHRRSMQSLLLSPNGSLAVTTDNLGRVFLVDTKLNCIIRVWKGYRRAQCGWVQRPEYGQKQSKSIVWGLYLVIYSCVRGFLEVWRMRYGPRVLSIAVGDEARLITKYNGKKRANGCAKCFIVYPKETDKICLSKLNGQKSLMWHLKQVFIPCNVIHEVVYPYFAQNTNQEEAFRLHLILDRFNAICKSTPGLNDNDHQLIDLCSKIKSDLVSVNCIKRFHEDLSRKRFDEKNKLTSSFYQNSLKHCIKVVGSDLMKNFSTDSVILFWQLSWQLHLVAQYIILNEELRANEVLKNCNNLNLLENGFSLHENFGDDFSLNASIQIQNWIILCQSAKVKLNFANEDTRAPLLLGDFLSLFCTPEVLTRSAMILLTTYLKKLDAPPCNLPFEIIKRVFVALGIKEDKIMKRAVLDENRSGRMFLFAPLLEDVFVIERLSEVHKLLCCDPINEISLFADWFLNDLSLSQLAHLVSIPKSSCAVYRWICRTFFVDPSSSSSPPPSPDASVLVVPHCCSTSGLLYKHLYEQTTNVIGVYALCFMMSAAEEFYWQKWQERSLGVVDYTAGAGLRWRILAYAASQSVYLCLGFGVLKKLTIESIENMDDFYRLVAVNQLTLGSLEALISADKPRIESRGSNDLNWPTNTSCKSKSDWLSVVGLPHLTESRHRSFLQSVLQSPELIFYRIQILCETWHRDRSRMHLLDSAVSCLISASLSDDEKGKAGEMARVMWKTFLSNHLQELVSFWQSQKKKKEKIQKIHLNVATAKQLFLCLEQVLQVIKSSHVSKVEQGRKVKDMKQSPNYDSEGDIEEEDHEDNVVIINGLCELHDSQLLAQKVLFGNNLTRSQILQHYVDKWPSMCTISSANKKGQPKLLASLETTGDLWNVQSITAHLQLVLLLDAFTTYPSLNSLPPLSYFPSSAFPSSHSFVPVSDPDNTSLEISCDVKQERMKFVCGLVHVDEKMAMNLGSEFNLDKVEIRCQHVISLFESGRDLEAEEICLRLNLQAKENIFQTSLAVLARIRLFLLLGVLKKTPKYATLLASLPADTCEWILSRKPPLAPSSEEKWTQITMSNVSLKATEGLLQRCLYFVESTNSIEYKKITKMLTVAKSLVQMIQSTTGTKSP